MLKIFKNSNRWLLICILAVTGLLAGCNDEDDVANAIQLHSYGPSPALRGGELRFIGTNLDQVSAILLPDNLEVTNFKTHTNSLIVIDVPQETMPGMVALRAPQGTISAQSRLGISEPITVSGMSAERVRPGEMITLSGTYLNLVEEVIFANNKVVTEFEEHSQEAITVRVPMDAQTGVVTVSNGEEEPIQVASEEELLVTLPSIASLTPATIKAGNMLTISGADLDLATEVVFGGDRKTEEFEVSEDGTEIMVAVPYNAQDGEIHLVAASLVEVSSEDALEMVVPTISELSPQPAKTGGMMTIKGTDLDLITEVEFGGEHMGEIQDGGSATEITVMVPAEAMEGNVVFHTAAAKMVESSESLTFVQPVVSGIAPATVKTQETITINGENLDVVAMVHFEGDTEGTIESASATELVVRVPPRSQSGQVRLVTTNGTEITTTQSITVEAGNVPTVETMPTSASPGEMIVIEGLRLDLTTEVIFPGDIRATKFGVKTANRLEVVVPEATEIGLGRITFITADGDLTESPEINIVGNIAFYIFDESLNSTWQRWDGWGTSEQDMANAEQPARGNVAIKVSYDDAYGAFQLHNTNAALINDYTHIVISIYGTVDSRIAIHGKDGGGNEFGEYPVTLVPGEYTTFEVPISELGNPDGLSELWIKNYGTNPNTIYIDDLGLR